jgi:hypothetical protein
MSIRRILLVLPFFVAFAFVPVVYIGDKHLWAPVWMAYVGLVFMAGDSLAGLGLCLAVIVVHVCLSIGCGMVVDRIFYKQRH